jgi:DNA-directed RNA polymerase specialized sigma24 family protein
MIGAIMPNPQSTCWTLIQAAAAGSAREREEFARRYAPVLRDYLAASWRGSPRLQDLEDVVQDVFVECLRRGGALENFDLSQGAASGPSSTASPRNVAQPRESHGPREQSPESSAALDAIPDDHTSLSRDFDRAWAKAILREAARLQEDQARAAGAKALRRVELLRLRFHDGLPIRDIACRWGCDAAVLHHEYARAREEFRAALLDVVASIRRASRRPRSSAASSWPCWVDDFFRNSGAKTRCGVNQG